jgi:cytochrome oxidase Cu insertion factor (SCO1/SenC/PrrC family)
MRKFILPFLLAATLPLAAQSSATAPVSAAAPRAPEAPPPAAGAPAPAFENLDQDGVSHALKALAGRPVLLAFYPSDFTGG